MAELCGGDGNVLLYLVGYWISDGCFLGDLRPGAECGNGCIVFVLFSGAGVRPGGPIRPYAGTIPGETCPVLRQCGFRTAADGLGIFQEAGHIRSFRPGGFGGVRRFGFLWRGGHPDRNFMLCRTAVYGFFGMYGYCPGGFTAVWNQSAGEL